jgi:hypothetical protein
MAGPARPYTDRDMLQSINGTPVFLGALVSAGTAVNNLTTATPFAATRLGPDNFINTLAGKMLLLQPTANGFILPAGSTAITLANQTVPPAAGMSPGLLIGTGERVQLLMFPNYGWLQWMSQAGAGNLLVWELS